MIEKPTKPKSWVWEPLCLFEILPCSYPPWKHVFLPSVFASETTMCGNLVAQDLVVLVYNCTTYPGAAVCECALIGSRPSKIFSLEQIFSPNLANLRAKHGDLLSKVSSDVKKLLLRGSPHGPAGPRQIHKSIQCCGLPCSVLSAILFIVQLSMPCKIWLHSQMQKHLLFEFDCLVVLPHQSL